MASNELNSDWSKKMDEAKRRGTAEQRASQARQRAAAPTAIERQAASNFLNKGLEFEASVCEQSQKIRNQSKKHYLTEWLDSRLILLSVVGHVIEAKHLNPGCTSEEISHRLILSMASFSVPTQPKP